MLPWTNKLAGRILIGTLGEERSEQPGVYGFHSSNDFAPTDVLILSQDAALDGTGEETYHRSGAPCVCVFDSDGGQGVVIGFLRIPQFDEDSDEESGAFTPAGENKVQGDKVYKTAGGATLILKRGGAVLIEGGKGVGLVLNPLNNQLSIRSSNHRTIADGYSATRGRTNPGGTQPETSHTEEFLHQVGVSFDRFTVAHGTLEGDARRQITLESVSIIAGSETATALARETYNKDGKWFAEGPEYKWGGTGADEPVVLGNALVDAVNELIDTVKELKVNTAWGPSTPPLPPTLIALDSLSRKLGDQILSTYMFTTKDPTEP
jgi:hypothetical protein